MEKERLDAINDRVLEMAHKIEDAVNTGVLQLIEEEIIQRELSIIILRSLSLTMGSYLYQMSGGKKEAFDMGVGLFADDQEHIFGMLETEASKKTEQKALEVGGKDDVLEGRGADSI